ncbi:hypothetical protein DER44DRAFT_869787 [Fusarium oxysporum]|nr:hypothetical protein DER44DRAFT_869787 [Fusarium oxysporum]
MHLRKRLCAPIYFGPGIIKDSAKMKLNALENLKLSQEWVDNSTFLNEDGSFSHQVLNERSVQVYTQKASLLITTLFSSLGSKDSNEAPRLQEQRLRSARRQLLVSILAHAWLWGRPKVLDNKGNLVPYEKRRVLAPQDILNFFIKVRAHEASYTYKETWEFLDKGIQEVALPEDTSKWNAIGVIACLRWDKSHNLHSGGPWCSCRLEKKLPPPYQEVPLNNSLAWSVDKKLPPLYQEVPLNNGSAYSVDLDLVSSSKIKSDTAEEFYL